MKHGLPKNSDGQKFKKWPAFFIFVLIHAAAVACSKGMILAFLDYAVPLGYNAGALSSCFFVFNGLGWIIPALFRLSPKKALVPSAVVSTLSGASMILLVSMPPLVVGAQMICAFSGSVFCYAMICGPFREIPYNRRGTAFGLAYGLSTLFNLPTRLAGLPFPLLQTVTGQQLYSLALMAAVLLAVLVLRKQPERTREAAAEEQDGIPARLVVWLMVCLFCMYTAYGMYNYMLDAYQFGRTAEFEHARIADVFANILVGVLCDFVGRPVTLIASAVLMMSGGLLILTDFGSAAVVLQALSIAGVLCFTVPVRLILVDASFTSKRPYLLCSLGFIGVNWFYSLGAPIAEAVRPMGTVALFSVDLVLCLFVTCCVTYIMERIRKAHVDSQKLIFAQIERPELAAEIERLSQEHGLTKRETQVLALSLGDKKPLEIAEELLVSEHTVRAHLSNIRRKMENGNGRQPEPALSARTEKPSDADMQTMVDRYSLTARETEILPLLLTSLTADEIAAALYISPNTVRSHIRNIVTKTGTANRRELQALAASIRKG